MQLSFGIGSLYAIRTDAGILTTPFGQIQEASLDLNFEIKELYGQNQFPISVTRAKAKITGKAKLAQINGQIFNELYFGQTLATGETIINQNFSATIPTTPFQVTIAPPNSGTFAKDLGVMNASGSPMTKVASAPATGQYSAAAAVYTFAAADTGLQVFINYEYTVVGGKTIAVVNQLMGHTPIFALQWGIKFNNQNFYCKLHQCISNKLNFPAKLDDYMVSEIDLQGFADAAGNVMTISLAE